MIIKTDKQIDREQLVIRLLFLAIFTVGVIGYIANRQSPVYAQSPVIENLGVQSTQMSIESSEVSSVTATPTIVSNSGGLGVTAEVVHDSNFWSDYFHTLTSNQVEYEWLYRVANCESTFREDVVDQWNGSHYGLFQYDQNTWNENCNGNIKSGVDQGRCALEMYRRGMQNRWSCK